MIDYHQDADGYGWLVLNRPEKANALCPLMLQAIIDHLTAAQSTCQAMVIRAKGKHFCAGADVNIFQTIQK